MPTSIQRVLTERSGIFLVSQDGVGYLVNFDPQDGFGYMCPCCFTLHERKAIIEAVSTALGNGTITGKVRWCCHRDDTGFGDHLNGYAPLKQEQFCSGSANADITPETKQLLRDAVASSEPAVSEEPRDKSVKQYQVVFTVTQPDQYKRMTFVGGWGGATAIIPKIVVTTVEAEDNADLQSKLKQAAGQIGSEYDPRYVVTLTSVNIVA
jgi:hypothetical protein